MSQCRNTDGTSTKPSIGTCRFLTGKGMLCTNWMLKPLSCEVSTSKFLSARKYVTSGIPDSIYVELCGVLNVFKHMIFLHYLENNTVGMNTLSLPSRVRATMMLNYHLFQIKKYQMVLGKICMCRNTREFCIAMRTLYTPFLLC